MHKISLVLEAIRPLYCNLLPKNLFFLGKKGTPFGRYIATFEAIAKYSFSVKRISISVTAGKISVNSNVFTAENASKITFAINLILFFLTFFIPFNGI